MKNKDISSLCFKLYSLIHAGIGLADALNLISDGADIVWLKAMAIQVDNGYSLSKAMKEANIFPAYVCGLIEVGEQTGHLENVLLTLSEYYEKRSKFDRYLKDTLTYPLGMMMLVLIVIGIILIKVMPIFNDVYSSFGARMTGIAGWLLTFGGWLDNILPIMFIVLTAILVGVIAFTRIKAFRKKIISLCGDKGIAYKINNTRIVQALALERV